MLIMAVERFLRYNGLSDLSDSVREIMDLVELSENN